LSTETKRASLKKLIKKSVAFSMQTITSVLPNTFCTSWFRRRTVAAAVAAGPAGMLVSGFALGGTRGVRIVVALFLDIDGTTTHAMG
jgi:hypothetical protein